MTAEQEMKKIRPGAYYEPLFGGVQEQGNEDEWLSDRHLPSKEAWADALRRIKEEKKERMK